MKNARTDRDDDSMNDFSEIDRRDFFRKRDLSEKIHLSTYWSSIENDFWLFWEWKDENRCLIDCFSFSSEFSIDWTNFINDDRSRDSDSRDSDVFSWFIRHVYEEKHEISLIFLSRQWRISLRFTHQILLEIALKDQSLWDYVFFKLLFFASDIFSSDLRSFCLWSWFVVLLIDLVIMNLTSL
jgi:hypothetical protein